MFEELLIFNRGGLILWTLGATLKGSPIDALVRSCFLEERSADSVFNYDAGGAPYTLKWAFNNELGLVFVAVYHHISQRLIVDDLLAEIRREFSEIYSPKRKSYPDFDETFFRLQKDAEARAEEMKKSKQTAQPASHSTTKNGLLGSKLPQKEIQGSKLQEKEIQKSKEKDCSYDDIRKGCPHEDGVEVSDAKPDVVVKEMMKPFDKTKLKNFPTKKGDIRKRRNNKSLKEGQIVPPKNLKLDYSADDGYVKEEASAAVTKNLGQSNMDMEDIDPSKEDEEEEENGKPGANKYDWLSSVFRSMAGNAVLENSDLEPALKALKDRLTTKNVAEEITEKLCESVKASLHGKKLGSFMRVSSTVNAAMEEALLRILTPKRSIDILREVHAAKEKGKPYIIVFVGVNGVGKSTNLAKVAYWLQQHNISVMLAACDTFRSGAVEQLRIHACRLKIDIFEKGYERDPTLVAKEAIKKAGLINEETGLKNADVVLVDTAGRMQDNEPLMKALSKLINVNNPDLVLFVGEALVGNEAVDQLMKFNQKLTDLSVTRSARTIDGILLTKFDTIDDKVGAALSMVYISGAPIMFVGCGQSYTDLKKLDIKTIVKTLLK